ncbi:hypothetical protein LTR86_002244 [Recurvomyces mirabilis]|nr:hypothetical protein LTR86_002244 [Recurvomyces mirabilis]
MKPDSPVLQRELTTISRTQTAISRKFSRNFGDVLAALASVPKLEQRLTAVESIERSAAVLAGKEREILDLELQLADTKCEVEQNRKAIGWPSKLEALIPVQKTDQPVQKTDFVTRTALDTKLTALEDRTTAATEAAREAMRDQARASVKGFNLVRLSCKAGLKALLKPPSDRSGKLDLWEEAIEKVEKFGTSRKNKIAGAGSNDSSSDGYESSRKARRKKK